MTTTPDEPDQGPEVAQTGDPAIPPNDVPGSPSDARRLDGDNPGDPEPDPEPGQMPETTNTEVGA
jgi:hypothetical protein